MELFERHQNDNENKLNHYNRFMNVYPAIDSIHVMAATT